MLVLSRRTNQRLLIGDSIEITVVELRDGHVRLGITAPKSVPVYRAELLEEITAENVAAVASARNSDVVAGALARRENEPIVAVLSKSGATSPRTKGG
ncbi:MAG: carbon storage regulator CsrA [Armatimonadota bacterium]|nr:carbon storage regulator CsrA [Armatimonadota bacterium]